MSLDQSYKRLYQHAIIAKWLLRPDQLNIYNMLKKNDKTVIDVHRRFGKCNKSTTLVLTTNGVKMIKDITTDDSVYGYNSNGTITPTKVLDVVNQGEKEVIDLEWNKQIYAICTDEHPFLTSSLRSNKLEVRRVKEMKGCHRFVTVKAPINKQGTKVKEAYALGALMGNGCSRDSGTKISSNDIRTVKRVAQSLTSSFTNRSYYNYTWSLTGIKKLEIPYYKEWIHDKYSHEKLCDYNIVKTWDYKSKMRLIAGLIDTDGCVVMSGGRVIIQLDMQAKQVLDTIYLLYLELFQIQARFYEDKRTKYKNGSVWSLRVATNKDSKLLLKELSKFMTCKHKKWKKEYETLNERNTNNDYIQLKKARSYKAECYDLSIGNDTNLYLTANGLVTHNTFTSLVYIAEECIKNKITVRMGGVTQKAVKDIFCTLMDAIFVHCPELMPKYDSSVDGYVFPNGSRISLFGNANSEEARKSRGGQSDIIYCDEFGFWRFKPHETLYSILLPQLQHSKLGKIIITSTMPKDLTHPYLTECAKARVDGSFYWQDINVSIACGTMTRNEADKIADRMGGWESEDFKREYLLQEIASVKSLVIPEAQDESRYAFDDYVRPEYMNWYVAVDLGLKDMSAALFAYHDFKESVLVVVDEHVSTYMTTEDKVNHWKEREKELGIENPRRFSDNDAQQIFDMNIQHKYPINPVVKRSKQSGVAFVESVINGLRIAIKEGKIRIHSRCVNLITQLKYGLWNEQRTDFERGTALGHLDALVALAYLIDNIQWAKNPYPLIDKTVKESTHYINRDIVDKHKNQLKYIIGGRK